MSSKSSRITAFYGIMIALAMVLSFVESQVPPFFAIPGMKLGLTNVVVLVMLYNCGWKSAVVINLVRIFLVGILFGNGVSLFFSLAGGLLSGLVMILMKLSGRFGCVTVSVCGGLAHNIGQIIMACFIMGTNMVLWYLTVLWFTGMAAGAAVGIAGGILVKRVGRSVPGQGRMK